VRRLHGHRPLIPAVERRSGSGHRLTGRAVTRLSAAPLGELPKPVIKGARRIGLLGLRGYLAIEMIMVVIKIAETALGH
jgi:hypothetical protein